MAGSLSEENEEKLTEVVRRYPVIYEKSEAGHRDNNIVLNAWKKVIALVDFVNDTNEAKILFQNIRKRYCKIGRRGAVVKGVEHISTIVLVNI